MNDRAQYPIDLSCLHSEPADHYHAQRDQYLSSHRLGEFRHCPMLFREKECGRIADKDSSAYALGRAVHCLTLEGEEAYREQFAIGGPINEKTGKSYGRDTKAFAAWAKDQSGNIITEREDALCQRLARAVHNHQLASLLLSDGCAEGVARTELHEVPCQIRCDWLNPKRGLVDLKTCDDLDWFERDARRYGYVNQLAFYRSVLRDVSGITVKVHLIAVEKQNPNRVGVWYVDDARLDMAEVENDSAIHALKCCRSDDTWPTNYEYMRVLAA